LATAAARRGAPRDAMRRYRILTWHVHGNYLYYLSHAPHDFHVLSKPGRGPGYSGRIGSLPWGDNVIDCPVATLPGREFDCVLYQSREHYLNDRESVLSVTQRRLPAIYLEHDPPLQHPTNTRHPVADPNVLVVHVTHYNALMWDNAGPTAVIEHGVRVPDALDYSGHVPRGIVIVNHLQRRGRRLGADVFARWRAAQPLDLYGMAAEESGGVGELPYAELMTMMASYRVYCHPVRYTSLALALCGRVGLRRQRRRPADRAHRRPAARPRRGEGHGRERTPFRARAVRHRTLRCRLGPGVPRGHRLTARAGTATRAFALDAVPQARRRRCDFSAYVRRPFRPGAGRSPRLRRPLPPRTRSRGVARTARRPAPG